MVFVKVRETYDLHTITGKMSIIGIHTPKSDLLVKNYPGLFMQCKAYRPVSCNVTCACASMLPADPLQVSTTSGDIAPEDLFNPILYKACTNQGLSQLEARIQSMYRVNSDTLDVDGNSAVVTYQNATNLTDEFNLYYGLLSDTHTWRHASPQAGFSMTNLKPLVYEMLYSVGDMPSITGLSAASDDAGSFSAPTQDGSLVQTTTSVVRGNAKPLPFMNCTSYTSGGVSSGFTGSPANHEDFIPAPVVFVGAIIVPPSRLHQLFYRMVVEWTIEFSGIRPVGEICSFAALAGVGGSTHYMTYDYSTTSKAVELESTELTNDSSTVSANVEVNKVM